MTFKTLNGVQSNYAKIKKDHYKNRVYYCLDYIDDFILDEKPDYNNMHFVFLFNLPLRKGISKRERDLITIVKNKLAVSNTVHAIFNYNSTYMKQHKILLLNPEIIRQLPKGIIPYLLSEEHFDTGWELTKKYIFECFLIHVKNRSKYLKQQNEARI